MPKKAECQHCNVSEKFRTFSYSCVQLFGRCLELTALKTFEKIAAVECNDEGRQNPSSWIIKMQNKHSENVVVKVLIDEFLLSLEDFWISEFCQAFFGIRDRFSDRRTSILEAL